VHRPHGGAGDRRGVGGDAVRVLRDNVAKSLELSQLDRLRVVFSSSASVYAEVPSLEVLNRASQAMTTDRAALLAMVEASNPGALYVDPEALMSPEGRGAFNDYKLRVFTWASAGPESKVSYTAEDLDRLFGEPADEGAIL
jgi:hypothetical protein